jgi:hypothetical protein
VHTPPAQSPAAISWSQRRLDRPFLLSSRGRACERSRQAREGGPCDHSRWSVRGDGS